MAAFIPALIGLGTQVGGGIAGLVQRKKANRDLEAAAQGRGLAARAMANRQAQDIQRQALSQRTTNPQAALRSASQLGQQVRQEANVTAAREQTVAQQLLSSNQRQDANALASLLGNLGSAGATFGAQLIATDTPEDIAAGKAQALTKPPLNDPLQVGGLQQQQLPQAQGAAQAQPIQGPSFGLSQTPGIAGQVQQPGDVDIDELIRQRLAGQF